MLEQTSPTLKMVQKMKCCQARPLSRSSLQMWRGAEPESRNGDKLAAVQEPKQRMKGIT